MPQIASALMRAAERRLEPDRLFASTEDDNTGMLALLDREGWTSAGAVAGANEDGRAELFLYKDLPDGAASTAGRARPD